MFEDQQGQFFLQQRGFYPQLHTLPAITVLQTPEIGQGRSLFPPSRENVTFSRFFFGFGKGRIGVVAVAVDMPKSSGYRGLASEACDAGALTGVRL